MIKAVYDTETGELSWVIHDKNNNLIANDVETLEQAIKLKKMVNVMVDQTKEKEE